MGLLARVRGAGGPDRGISLVEMLVATTLTVVVGALVASSFLNTSRLFRATDAEFSGQTDVRTTIERLGRDLRTARQIDAGANASQLVMWVDSNSDYLKQADEVVTWKLVASSGGHYDVTRLAGGTTVRTARLVVSQLAFCYRTSAGQPCLALPLSAAAAASVRLVSSDIEYDAVVGGGTTSRHTEFTERLRNVS